MFWTGSIFMYIVRRLRYFRVYFGEDPILELGCRLKINISPKDTIRKNSQQRKVIASLSWRDQRRR